MKLKEITMCAVLTAVLFVQEELLSFIPNVQLTVMLILAYSATLKPIQTFVIVTVHVLLDNVIMGSMTPTVVVPMFVGWMLVAVIGYLVRKCPLWVVVVASVVGSLIYSLCFVVVNYFVLHVDLLAYLIADIPFDVLMCCSSVVTVLFLYQPVCKLISKNLVRTAG